MAEDYPILIFHFLRLTVRVTAAVYWAFDSMREHLLLSFQHRAGVRPYTSCYHFAESCVFNKQSPLLILCQHHQRFSSHESCSPFFQSYGINLPSSLSMVLSKPWVFSTCSPVSVCSTVNFWKIERFYFLKLNLRFFNFYGFFLDKCFHHRHHKILPIKDCFHIFFRGRLTLRR